MHNLNFITTNLNTLNPSPPKNPLILVVYFSIEGYDAV